MNCVGIQDTVETAENQNFSSVGYNNHSLSIVDLPLTKEKVETAYPDIFQHLGKFPGNPYKLRLKPYAVPAKHRPRKVPVHLQDAFHEEHPTCLYVHLLVCTHMCIDANKYMLRNCKWSTSWELCSACLMCVCVCVFKCVYSCVGVPHILTLQLPPAQGVSNH